MDRSNLEMFAQTYPKGSSSPSGRPPGSPTTSMRTPLREVVSPVEEGFFSSPKKSIPKHTVSAATKDGTKKFLAILLIVFLGAFIYSAFAYTISDHLFGKLGVEFFSDTGQPGTAIIAIHSLVFLGFTYAILNSLKWWHC